MVDHHPFLHPFSRRFHLMLLLMFGYFTMAIITNNIGITINCMVNSTAVAMESGINDTSAIKDYGGTYIWSIATQNNIVAAASFGGILVTFHAGYYMDRKSVRHLLLISVLTLSFASLLTPLAAESLGEYAVFFLRLIMGLGEGLMLPGLNAMVTRWIPVHEKSLGASLYTSGNQFAGIIGNPAAAALCDSPLRWPSVFYLCGCIGILWTVMWLSTVNNSPATSKWITEKERAYLEHHIPKAMTKGEKRIPWLDMIRSKPLIANIFGSVVTNMMLTFLLVYMPVYFKDVLQLDVKNNGLYSSIPHVFNLLSKIGWGYFMDELKRRKILSPTTCCKISQLCAMIVISISFALLGYCVDSSTPELALVLLCCIGGGFGLCISGFLTSLLSIAPNHIGVLSSIIQIIGFGARFSTPILITLFKTTGTPEEWRSVMWVYIFLCTSSAVIFTAWGSGDIQSWNYSVSANRTPASSELGANSSNNRLIDESLEKFPIPAFPENKTPLIEQNDEKELKDNINSFDRVNELP